MNFNAAILVTVKANWGYDVTYSFGYVMKHHGKSEKKNIGFSPEGQQNHIKRYVVIPVSVVQPKLEVLCFQ
jgi:hypothetical protein